ncbi:MAG: hypothetical protein OXJ52_00425 [Oligoflexia bacterium]|nr:hypothetical protein [Oligoflexia bacterium]
MFYYFLSFFIVFFPLLSSAKYQVCSITINSSDEIEAFKEFLPAQDFDFVELLPQAVNEKQDHSAHWFDTACEQNYRCDILVISGHFGGTFFGKSGYSLPTELMEEKSCQNKCQGVLSGVKEIFLFGCNTLADKTKDNRTYSEYLKVLLEDGMARETAERVVAARYSPLETPFYERMNFIFSGSRAIYGFDQLSPLGKHIRKPLRAYFQSINEDFGGYARYLKSGQYKRPLNEQLFQQMPRPVFTLNQASLSVENEDQNHREFFKNKCRLYDSTKAFPERLRALEDIFYSSQSGSAFFAIDHFLNYNRQEVMEGRGRMIFRSIRENSSLAKEFLSYYQQLDFLPYIKMVYLNILEKFQWMDPVELHALRKDNLLEIINNPDPEAYISLLLLLKEGQLRAGQFYISKETFPEDYIENIWALLILEKLKAIAPEWQEDIFNYCQTHLKRIPAICYQSLNTLAHIKPKREIALQVFEFLDYEDSALAYYSLRVLGQSGIENYHVHKRIAGFLNSGSLDLKKSAIEALGFLESPYEDIQEDMAGLLRDENLAVDIFWSLSQMKIESATAQKRVLSSIKKFPKNPSLKCSALKIFKQTPELSDFSLFFFYKLLESREDLSLLFCAIDSLSQNPDLRDLGIHYRFLLFQTEDSVDIKRKALQNMSALTWLNPEVQLSFLNYLKDEDLEVRKSAVRVLRNIENLKKEVLEEIHRLYKEERILELKSFI